MSGTLQMPIKKHPNGVRLLALDGGGVKGICALRVLHELMERVRQRLRLPEDEPCRPVDFFELAGGTSTGGIIALMLFRLRMTPMEAIEQYNDIAQKVFSPRIRGYDVSWMGWLGTKLNNSKMLVWSTRFDDVSMKTAIDSVVAKYGLDENDRQLKGQAPLFHEKAGRMFLCTTAQNRAETVLMKSYSTDDAILPESIVNRTVRESRHEMTIDLATRATSAAPTFFPEVKWKGLTFWDGGLLNNNPVDRVWATRFELVGPADDEPAVSCLISIGCGYNTPGKSPASSWLQLTGTVGTVIDFATNTEAKGKDFSRHVSTLKTRQRYAKMRYVRLQPNLAKEDIGLADYTRMSYLDEKTIAYLKEERGQFWINEAVDAICA